MLAAPEPAAAVVNDEPAQIRDLQQRVSARVNLGYVVDGTQLNPGRTDLTLDNQFAKIRAYGFGEGYLSTHGIAFDSLSSYFAGRFILANQITTYDPATPYRGAKRLAAELGNVRFLTMVGDGHTAFGGNSQCIDDAVVAQIETLALPAVGTTCQQTVPFVPADAVIP